MERVPGADHRVIATGTGGAARQALRVLAVGALLGLLFGAVPLRQWTEGLDPAPWSTRLQAAALEWEATVGRLGLNRPYQALHAGLRRVEAS